MRNQQSENIGEREGDIGGRLTAYVNSEKLCCLKTTSFKRCINRWRPALHLVSCHIMALLRCKKLPGCSCQADVSWGSHVHKFVQIQMAEATTSDQQIITVPGPPRCVPSSPIELAEPATGVKEDSTGPGRVSSRSESILVAAGCKLYYDEDQGEVHKESVREGCESPGTNAAGKCMSSAVVYYSMLEQLQQYDSH